VARRGQAFALCTDHSKAYTVGYEANAPCPAFDGAGASAMLKADGWVAGSDGVLAKNGQRLEFNYSTTANNFWRADDELIMQQDLTAIGIKLDITNYPASTFFGSFLLGGKSAGSKFDIAEYETSGGTDPDDSSLFSCNQVPPAGFNITYYCNPALDKLYAQETATIDPTARQTIFDQIHKIYLTDFPFVVLYGAPDIAMHKLTVHNYDPAPTGSAETVSNWTWWCTGGHC
jgi:peptide/nickel transport system substrate-binding protein